MQVEKPIPPALIEFARNTFGDSMTRYGAILDSAFREHIMLLNAKQLREIAGSGTHTTAQAAINIFRERLHKRLGFRLDIGGGVPEEIAGGASQLIVHLWGEARRVAAAEYESERQQALASAHAAQSTISAKEARIAELDGQRAEAAQEAASLRTQLETTVERLAISERERERLAAAEQALVHDLQALGQQFAAAKAEAETRMTAAQREHREQLGAASRAHASEVQRLTGERDQAAKERDKARSDGADAEIGRARAEQAVSIQATHLTEAQQRLAAAETALARAQEEAREAKSDARAQAEAVKAAERAAKAAAFDSGSLIEWLHDGVDGKAAGLGKAEALVAKSILGWMRARAAELANDLERERSAKATTKATASGNDKA